MKIVVFIEDFGPTGVVRNVLAIAGRLSADGRAVTIIAARDDGVLRGGIPAGIEVRTLNPAGHAGTRGQLLRRSLLRFRTCLTEIRPDVVFSAGNHGHLLTIAATRFLACRVVVRVSNDLDHRKGGRPVSGFARISRRLKFRTILGRADRIVLVSQRLLNQVRSLDEALARKAVVISNGVDVATVRAQAEQPADGFDYDGPVALAVGRLVAQKNFGTLLEAVAIARRSIDLNLLLIGSGPLKAELQERAQHLGLGDAFRIIDPVSNPFPLFRQADVFVLPSWWEGSSNVLLEALACGTPVVASRTAGSAEEVLDEGRYGLLVDPSDAQALADAIIRQVGPDALGPQDRAADYDRSKSLDAYADLIAGLDAR